MNAKNIKEITPSWAGQTVVYIAGKVTGLSFDEVQANFNSAEFELEKQGYTTINPIKLVHFDADWQQAMRICISFLPHADFVFLLDNYLDSRGALQELHLCSVLGIPVLNGEVLVSKPDVRGSCEKLLNICKERNLHCSITYQKITDFSIEIYTGYRSDYEKVYYSDGHIELDEPLLKAIGFISDLG